MLRRRREQEVPAVSKGRVFADFHEWVLSLPWTVEQPGSVEGVRYFGVDCEPLGRRRIWMVTGLHRDIDPSGLGLAVIVPNEAAHEFEERRWGRTFAPLSAGHSLVTIDSDSVARREVVEALVLTAYSYAVS